MHGLFPPPSPPQSFAAALSSFYHPVKVVAARRYASSRSSVPPRPLRLDFGCHSESAGGFTHRHAQRSSVISL